MKDGEFYAFDRMSLGHHRDEALDIRIITTSSPPPLLYRKVANNCCGVLSLQYPTCSSAAIMSELFHQIR